MYRIKKHERFKISRYFLDTSCIPTHTWTYHKAYPRENAGRVREREEKSDRNRDGERESNALIEMRLACISPAVVDRKLARHTWRVSGAPESALIGADNFRKKDRVTCIDIYRKREIEKEKIILIWCTISCIVVDISRLNLVAIRVRTHA